jgi:hypothetical protein
MRSRWTAANRDAAESSFEFSDLMWSSCETRGGSVFREMARRLECASEVNAVPRLASAWREASILRSSILRNS